MRAHLQPRAFVSAPRYRVPLSGSDACRALLQNASARGSRDDKAAIVVRLGAAAAAEAARSTSCEI